ncbi:MAG: N-acetylneuraminate synthase family protein [Nitrospirae bacterium]|nr:N-acetylneuraminate synthase family protein [Nitrospirota bacterium]
MGNHTTIIAEIGENFIGDLDIAASLVDKAAEAGADIVKFQSYRWQDFRDDDPEKEWFKKVTLSDAAHFMLKERADKAGIGFLSTPFTVERAKFLVEQLGLRQIKIASGIMLNFPIMDYINNSGVEHVLVSTGMATIDEINAAVKMLNKIKSITILHCVTQYPCRDEDANLTAIQTLLKQFQHPIGYSDHTIGTDACIAAAALGASVIEKHYTFDNNCKEGTDHEISVEPAALRSMVQSIRRVEKMLGSGIKVPCSGEREIINFVRNRF